MRRAALAALATLPALAAEAREGPLWYTQIENDIVFETDRWYTGGFRLARVESSGDGRRTEWGLGQELYTPDLKLKTRAAIDRPYVGRLYLSRAWHQYAPGLHRTLELTAGLRGPAALGRQSQDFIHRIIPGPQFDWSRQLGDGVDVQAIAIQSHELDIDRFGVELAALHYGAVLGNNVTFAHAGFDLRLARDGAIPPAALRFAATPPIAREKNRAWSGFAGFSARWIARNTFLSRNDEAGGPVPERKDAVLRFAVGVARSTAWGALTFSVVQDSREFTAQRRPHRFGILGVRVDTF